VTGVAAIGHGPERRPRQDSQQALGLGQLGGLAWCQRERDCSAAGIGERMGFGPITAAGAAKGLSLGVLLRP
jgi:hypothetical protein